MNDTSPDIEQRFRAMLLSRSREERLKIGCSMHTCAQEIVRASVQAKTPQVSPTTLRQSLFLRFYGKDFDATTRERILLAIENFSKKEL